MHIKQAKDAVLVGEIQISNDYKYRGNRYVKYQKKLQIKYDSSFDKSLKNKKLSIVYIIAVDGEIRKIGQTSGSGGIANCLSFYCIAGFDDPSIRSFAINYLMREEIKKGSKIEIYMKYLDLIPVQAPGLFSVHSKHAAISAKVLEEACLDDYQAIHGTGVYPSWNFQEKGSSLYEQIQKEYAEYVFLRKS